MNETQSPGTETDNNEDLKQSFCIPLCIKVGALNSPWNA